MPGAALTDARGQVGTPPQRRPSSPARHRRRGTRGPGHPARARREEVVRGQWAHLLPRIPPGENYLHFTAERGHPEPLFEWRSRYWSFLLKLSPDKPAPTIQAQPGPNVGPFHWDNRRIRVPELKRLFTYPDDFELVGSRTSIQSQIGNSVPPRLAEQVASTLAHQ